MQGGMDMNRNFNRFLEDYCKELANTNTLNIRKLVVLATSDRPRLREPLLLYCLSKGKQNYLLNVIDDNKIKAEYIRVIYEATKHESVEKYLLAKDTPKRYAQVLDAFYAQGKDIRNSDLRINELLRKKILAELKGNNVTRYEVCKSLGLNTGNVYTYLSGDSSKVSKNTAQRIYDFVLGK